MNKIFRWRITVSFATLIPLASCSQPLSTREKGALAGGGLGAATGAIIGAATGMGYASYPQILDSLQEAAEDYLNQLVVTMRGKDFSVQTVAPVGLPADKIVRYAHEHPGSLVVMTTHGRTGFAGFVLGSVVRRVVLHGNTPTLVVRPTVTPAAANPSTTN